MTKSRQSADFAAGGPSVAGKNYLINGGMDVWQRGTSFALSANVPTYTADRWYNARATAGQTVSRQVTGDTTNLPNIQYCARVQRDNANTSTTEVRLAQAFETVNSIPVAGQTVTLSFYARRGANYSSASNLLSSQIYTGTGTDQNLLTGGYTGSSLLSVSTPTLTTTWQRFTQTATVSATATEITVLFTYTPVGTAGAADFFEITGVQLEVGSVATPFSRAGGTIAGELAACQRYYYRANSTANNSLLSTYGAAENSTTGNFVTQFPTQLRTNPTSIDYANLLVGHPGVAGQNGLVATIQLPGVNFVLFTVTVASGLTQYRPTVVLDRGSNNGYIGFSAEL
jgi:hypothetical protein